MNPATAPAAPKAKATATVPTQKSISAARTALDGANLETLAAAVADACAALGRMDSVAKGIKASVSETTLRIVTKEKIADIVGPLRDACTSAGAHVPNLRTIRTAVIKMIVAYGQGITLPAWSKVAEAKDAGDAAVRAALASCIVQPMTKDAAGNPMPDGEPRVDPAVRDDVLARIEDACKLFLLSEDSIGRIRAAYHEALQAMAEDAEQAADDAAADAEAEAEKAAADAEAAAQAAQTAAELEYLREIAIQARRILAGVVDLPDNDDPAALAIALASAPTLETDD